jgi:5-formyltetrahydrofolate cyclo-ligase
MSDLGDQKKAVRDEVRLRLQQISPEERLRRSTAANDLIRQQPAWARSKSVLFYSALASELDVFPLLKEAHAGGKTILLPRFDPIGNSYHIAKIRDFPGDMIPAKFGILEPGSHCPEFAANHLDFALVPGVAFDALGARLGRGRGFYDRLLAQVTGMKCGIAFDEQIFPHLPTAPHDVRMNFVVTPTRWIDPAPIS